MNLIICYDDHGRTTAVPHSEIAFRPAVYGVLIENNQVLLQSDPETKLWRLPGGVLDGHESANRAVRYRFRSLTGVIPIVGPLLLVEEKHYLDREGCAWRLAIFYYALERPSLGPRTLIEFDNMAGPEWVPLNELTRQQFQFGYDAVQTGRLRLA